VTGFEKRDHFVHFSSNSRICTIDHENKVILGIAQVLTLNSKQTTLEVWRMRARSGPEFHAFVTLLFAEQLCVIDIAVNSAP